MTAEHPDWLIVRRGETPLVVSIPHAGVDLAGFEPAFVDPWLARKDADWRLDALYDFVEPLGATVVRTKLSRSIIDVNRDPSGASLYPGQATTELCPTTTFDGEPLYRAGQAPDAGEIERAAGALLRSVSRGAERRDRSLAPDVQARRAVRRPLDSLAHPAAVRRRAAGVQSRDQFRGKLRSRTSQGGRGGSRASNESVVVDGRFKGGWITRAYGKPDQGVEALQLELACRAYMQEPERPAPDNWPTPIDEKRATPTRATLKRVLEAILSGVGA